MPTYVDHSMGFAVGDKVGMEHNGVVRWVQIKGKERLIYRYTHSAAISAGGTASAFTDLSDLDPADGELYYLQKIEFLRGNLTLTLRQPGAVNRFGTNIAPSNGEINVLNDDAQLDVFVQKNLTPQVSFANNGRDSTTPRLKFHGWKYVYSDIPSPSPGEPKTVINIPGSR